MVGACVLLAYAAVDNSFAAELSDGRRGGLLRATRELAIAGINIPLAVAASYLFFETLRFLSRWADGVAIRATAFGLRPHRSTFLKPMRWNEVSRISFRDTGWSNSLVIRGRDGSTRTIRGVDNTDGAAEQFVADVSRHCE
jgi:hypothetical protein